MEKKTKILQVCRLSHLWGMDLFKEITKAFIDEKYEVTTVFLSNKPGYEKYKGYEDYNGEVILFGIDHHGIFWRFIAIWKLIKLFKKKSFDAVITHHYKPMVLVEITNRVIKIPKLLSVNHNNGNLRTFTRRVFVKYFLNKQWKFISVSNGVQEDLLSSNAGLTLDRMKTISNSIDINSVKMQQLSRNTAREALGIPDNRFVFGNIARLVSLKGHSNLIQAFAKICKKENNSLLVIIGVGKLYEKLKALTIEEDIAKRVIIETQQALNAAKFLKAFDAFVLPSFTEGLPIVLLEAMSAKLPIIATNVGGIPDVIGKIGYLIPPKDIGMLSEAMEAILNLRPAEREELGIKIHERLKDKFSIEKYYKEFQEIITR